MTCSRAPRSFAPVVLGLLAALLGGLGPAAAQIDPLTPATSGGVPEIDRELGRLVAQQRLLVIGAHPDDEDTSLLAYATRGLGADAAYLSL